MPAKNSISTITRLPVFIHSYKGMLLAVLAVASSHEQAQPLPSPPAEPYPPLHGGRFVPGYGAASNPDPLKDYVWDEVHAVNASLQLTTVLPARASAFPPGEFPFQLDY